MDFDAYLNLLLKGSPPPTTLGLNIFPVLAPPSPPAAYCVYQIVSSPKLLVQEGKRNETKQWVVQFKQFAPSQATVARDTASLSDFLVGYSDLPGKAGIQRVFEVNTFDLPATATGRTFCRMTELHFTENLSQAS